MARVVQRRQAVPREGLRHAERVQEDAGQNCLAYGKSSALPHRLFRAGRESFSSLLKHVTDYHRFYYMLVGSVGFIPCCKETGLNDIGGRRRKCLK